jgi:nucleoid-associated protein YgaU
VRPVDRNLEQAIVDLLERRGAGATICPSEAARRVADQRAVDDWRTLMEPTRAAARRLVASGDLEIVQGGRVVDPSTVKGPIRLRRRRAH